MLQVAWAQANILEVAKASVAPAAADA